MHQNTRKAPLQDFPVNVKLLLAGLWTAVMFCYIYADYFGLYVPGMLQSMLDGKMGPLGPTTQGVLLGTSALMSIPAVMIALSLLLRPTFNRWLNLVAGVLFTLIICLTMWGWRFYIYYGVIEIAMTLGVVWYAWTWPRQKGAK
ncbi:MAG TPA: DUF6326 family protein [Gammaproteobacteria bacterium]|nr:DUF6326 family protein [Gammaproteobacteria bacterium]